MPTRAEALASQFEAANDAAIAVVSACSDSAWRAACPDDGRSVAVVAHHIATGDAGIGTLVETAAKGLPPPPITREMIDQGNAQQAREHANATKEEVLQALRENVIGPAALVRGLTDEQLDRKTSILANEMTTEQIIQMILIGHVTGHLESIRSAGA
jgi:uncharacterized damage-inducible protein DinB